jgi:hypothetical protein
MDPLINDERHYSELIKINSIPEPIYSLGALHKRIEIKRMLINRNVNY